MFCFPLVKPRFRLTVAIKRFQLWLNFKSKIQIHFCPVQQIFEGRNDYSQASVKTSQQNGAIMIPRLYKCHHFSSVLKKINLLLFPSFHPMTNTILKSVGYLSVGNASKRHLLITDSTKKFILYLNIHYQCDFYMSPGCLRKKNAVKIRML